MTFEEAAEKLKRERDGVCRGCMHPSMLGWCENHCKLPEAFDMAIEALKQQEIITCKDCRKHNVRIGFDENLHTVWKKDACPLVDWRGKARQHEFDYQYCVYAERRTDD